MPTAQTFIDRTLNLIGRLRPGQGAGPSESSVVLEMLNQLLESWSTDHTAIYTIYNHQYLLTPGKGYYVFGPVGSLTADFAVGRPVKIQSAGIIRGGLRFDLEQIDSKQWDLIREKRVPAITNSVGVQALLPLKLFNDNAYPETTLHLWPTPGNGALGGTDGEDAIWRTLLLKDTAVGNDIADHITVQEPGMGTSIKAVLRKVIAADLTVEVVKEHVVIGTITIPAATSVDQPITLDISTVEFVQDEVLAWNVTHSDGQTDLAGVASVTVEWKKVGPSQDFSAAYLDLSIWLQLAAIANLGSSVDFPPGYGRAIMNALAIEVASQFGLPIPPSVAAIADQSKRAIQMLNVSNNIPAEDVPQAPAA